MILKKIIKYQTGGSVPVYARYEMTGQQRPTVNVGVLMQPYAKTTKTPSIEVDKDKYKDAYKVEGLTNDMEDYSTEMQSLMNRLEDGMKNTKVDYLNTDEGRFVKDKVDVMMGPKQAMIKRRAEKWNLATANMIKDGNNYSNQWYYKQNKGFVKNRETGEYEYINPNDLYKKGKTADGKEYNIYDAVPYSEAAKLLETDRYSIIRDLAKQPSKFIYNENMINDIGSGISSDKVYKDIINPMFENLGSTKEANEVIFGNIPVEEGKKNLKEYLEGTINESNKANLDEAFSNIYNVIGSSPGYDSLIGKAYTNGAKSLEEATEMVHKDIAAVAASKLKITVDNKRVREAFTEAEDQTNSANGGGSMNNMSKMLVPIRSKTNPINLDIAVIDKANSKDILTHLTGQNGNVYRELIDPSKTLIQNVKLAQVFNIKSAFIANGIKLADITINHDPGVLSNNIPRSLLETAVLSSDQDIVVLDLPTDKETGAIVDLTSDKDVQQLMRAIKAKQDIINNPATLEKVKTAFRADIEKLKNENAYIVANKYNMKKVASLDITFNKGENEENIQNDGGWLKKQKNIIDKAAQPNDIATYINTFKEELAPNTKWKGWSDQPSEAEFFVRTKIFVDILSDEYLQYAGGEKVKIPQEYNTSDAYAHQQNSTRPMTLEEVRVAVDDIISNNTKK